uniref:Uncharacterized protein n=1 Tax=Arundo donax TaxID=35708 RepID=A0A0A8YIZ1_ARUDO
MSGRRSWRARCSWWGRSAPTTTTTLSSRTRRSVSSGPWCPRSSGPSSSPSRP